MRAMNDGKPIIEELPLPTAKIETEDQARNWVLELTQDMLEWREKCDVVFPDNSAQTAQYQKRAMWTFLEKHGQVIGALKTLKMCGLISDRCYMELNQQALNTLIPRVVGGS